MTINGMNKITVCNMFQITLFFCLHELLFKEAPKELRKSEGNRDPEINVNNSILTDLLPYSQ